MTYLTFLLVFLVLPIALLAFLQRKPLAGVGGVRALVSLPLVCLIAFLYTTPWDNYLVYKEVWWHGADRVIGTIGYVPFEEYAFFILQPILTGLFLYYLLSKNQPDLTEIPSQKVYQAISFFWLAITAIGFLLLASGWENGLYMGLILAWCGPVILGMWLYGGRLFLQCKRPFMIGITIPTIYLWIADWTAISLGIWDISDRYSFGLDPFGLPIEEATFFLCTNVLVIEGILLFLYGDRIAETRTLALT